MIRVFAIGAILVITCTAMMLSHWSNVDADNNAFAKDCNDRGGLVEIYDGFRQCLGAVALARKEG